jgi:hypothetical protein
MCKPGCAVRPSPTQPGLRAWAPSSRLLTVKLAATTEATYASLAPVLTFARPPVPEVRNLNPASLAFFCPFATRAARLTGCGLPRTRDHSDPVTLEADHERLTVAIVRDW